MKHISLLRHPLVYIKKKWRHHQCHHGVLPDNPVERQVEGIRFVFDFSLGKDVKRMYYGSYELEIKEAMRKHLKPGGMFLDIGANIGYLSAIGARLVGKNGSVHSFEPVPRYFSHLAKLADLNPDYNIRANNLALGDNCEVASMYVSNQNIGCNSMLAGFIGEEMVERKIAVSVKRLDAYLDENKLLCPSLIKIDVEGFELPVLKGASGLFKDNKTSLPPIIVEVTPSAYKKLNSDLVELDEFMLSFGYKSYCVLGGHRIDIKGLSKQTDT